MTRTSKLIQDILTAMPAIQAALKDTTSVRAFEAALQSLSDCLTEQRKAFLGRTTSQKNKRNALSKIAEQLKLLQVRYEELEKRRQKDEPVFESVDEKMSQIISLLSTVMKSEKDMEAAIIRNML